MCASLLEYVFEAVTIHCKADENVPHEILSNAPQYFDICRCHNTPNFTTRYSTGLGGNVLTCSYRCVPLPPPPPKFQLLDSSTDLHAQSTIPEYFAFSHCQTSSSRVLGVHRAENTTSDSQEAQLPTATVEPFLGYYNIK